MNDGATGAYGTRGSLLTPIAILGAVLGGHCWHHGGAVVGSEALWLAGMCAQVLIRWPHMRRNRANHILHRRIDVQEKALLGAVFAGMLLLPGVTTATPWLDQVAWQPNVMSVCLGAALLGAGLWLFWRSHADLGRNWSPSLEIREAQHLVAHGIYRSIRHPMYAAIWLLAAAQALLVPNWISGPAGLLAFGTMYWLRVPREEAMLVERFGDAYREYASRTGRVSPCWRRR